MKVKHTNLNIWTCAGINYCCKRPLIRLHSVKVCSHP
jgi:hypothetical protein